MRPWNVVQFALLLVGCDWNGSTNFRTIGEAKEPSIRQARGPFYTSPKYGCIVSPPADLDAAKVLEWVDIRVEQWITTKTDWGGAAFSDEHLAAMARSVPIIVYSGYYVPADGTWGVTGWCLYDVRIEVSEREGVLSAQGDPIDELRSLPHELTHLVLGDFHH